MCVELINWCAFSWEAFATLATGLAAVVAAWRVGRKQVMILDRQTAIQEQTLRSELFDKRFHVYRQARALLEYARFNIQPAPEELHNAYLQGMLESRFLFDDKVYSHLVKLRSDVSNFDRAAMELQDEMLTKNRSREIECRAAITKIHKSFADELEELPSVFYQLNIEKSVSREPLLAG